MCNDGQCFGLPLKYLLNTYRPLVKSASQKVIDLISQPKHMLWVLKKCATSKDSDQPAHMRSLIRAFAR